MHTATLNGPRLTGSAAPTRVRRVWVWLLCALLLTAMFDARASVAVKAARLGSTVDSQRIVIELAAPVAYKYFTLSNPNRLVLDLEGVDPESPALKSMAANIKADDVYLAGMRLAANRPGVTRLVTDLKTVMRPLVSLLKANASVGPRLVIDLVPGAPVTTATTLSGPAPALAAAPSQTAPSQPAASQTQTAVPQAPSPQAAAPQAPSTQVAPSQTATPQAEPVRTSAAALVEAKPVPSVSVGATPAPVSDVPVAATSVPVAPAASAQPAKAATVTPTPAKAVKIVAPSPVKSPAKAPVAKPDNVIRVAAAASLDRQVEQAIQQSDKVSPEAKPAKPENNYKRLVTVAIDPGHGGVDPGALGANGSQEKDITLAVARRLKTHIDKQEGMRAVLTRDGDYFIPLHERVNKARRNQADLFVSIHADAFLKATAKGSSVFALSEKGASSAAARWLAKRENDADLVGGVNIDVKDVYLKQTLIDLTQTATIADSLRLGKAVLDEIGEINTLHKPRVEQAGFAVLKAPDIPSILVETAFISNPDEEARLIDEDYQDKMAAAIVTGIKAYFDNNPPLARSKVAQNF